MSRDSLKYISLLQYYEKDNINFAGILQYEKEYEEQHNPYLFDSLTAQ
jgi:hypothetical protein